MNHAKEMINKKQKYKYLLIVDGTIVGMLSGAITILYRLAIDQAEYASELARNLVNSGAGYIVLWVCALVLLAFAANYLLKWEPMISGSGIPQVEAEVSGYLKTNWLKTLLAKFAGGVICLFAGLSLGREGPSIQMGAMSGKGLSAALHRNRTEEKYLMTCGASAGLSAAFNAPLAGIMFALEEVHKNFSAYVLVPVMISSIVADFLSKYIFGLSPVFHFSIENPIPLQYYWMIIIFGVLVGFLGAGYNKVLFWGKDKFAKIKDTKFRLIPVFLLAGVLGYLLPQVVGSGHDMIRLITDSDTAFKLIMILLIGKFIFSIISFGSGAPGGIFFPLLVIGAYIGAAYGHIMIAQFGIDSQYFVNFIIIAMAGYFSAIVRAPITGIILITEMTGSFSHMLAIATVAIVAYITAELIGSVPVYEGLLDRIVNRVPGETVCMTDNKMIIQNVVHANSALSNKRIFEIAWPEDVLLISLKRGTREILPRGRVKIMAGDILETLVMEDRLSEYHEFMKGICEADPTKTSTT